MSVSSPSEEDFSDELVEALAGEVVGGTTRDQMLGTMSGISLRLVTAHNGTVRMHAEIEDPKKDLDLVRCEGCFQQGVVREGRKHR